MVRRSSVVVLLAGAILIVGCGGAADVVTPGMNDAVAPRRIVSLAPSLTETLFALGLGDRVVGVTRYCAYPPEALALPKIGGHLDPNFEAIVSLDPDLVVVIPSSHESGTRLESLGIRVLEVDQHDVESVLESVSVVAEACGMPERGRALRVELESRLAKVVSAVDGAPRPRAVVVVGHQVGEGAVRSVWAAGRDTFYDGVLQIAGGVNAVNGGLARYPEFSREGLYALDPDVVLDVIAGIEDRNLDLDAVRQGWMRLTELRAVRENRVNVLEGDQMVVPGPRLPEMVEAVARALHPELEWGRE
ncbi:MAG: helical backbone metal receptor [Thermoanaerobaculales bacterium]|nr:helical backbone metal receptor [Thermoanaerobaculales bacterium]